MTDPTSQQTEILDQLAATVAEAQRAIDGIGPDQWDLPTPCTEWSVRDLVRHMVGGNRMATAAFDAPLSALPDDPLGDDPAAAFAASGGKLLERLGRPGALQETATGRMGPVPGERLATLRFVDLLSHTWDVATATGQPTDFAPELNAAALAISRRMMASFDRAATPMFAPEQPAPAGASAADVLAAFLGRQVR